MFREEGGAGASETFFFTLLPNYVTSRFRRHVQRVIILVVDKRFIV